MLKNKFQALAGRKSQFETIYIIAEKRKEHKEHKDLNILILKFFKKKDGLEKLPHVLQCTYPPKCDGPEERLVITQVMVPPHQKTDLVLQWLRDGNNS